MTGSGCLPLQMRPLDHGRSIASTLNPQQSGFAEVPCGKSLAGILIPMSAVDDSRVGIPIGCLT
jgi:hypothetical protein